MEFNSQICTSIAQSETLLKLGLKKETADMVYMWHWESDDYSLLCASWEFAHRSNKDIPAWSLHRLIEMVSNSNAYGKGDWLYGIAYNAYEKLIESISEMIHLGYFNKEYLCEK